MKVNDRAAQIWPLLALAARNRQILSYDLLSRLTGVLRPGLGQLLEPIQSYCLVHHLPALTGIVVSENTGVPGTGFTATADVPAMQARVFAHDWLSEPVPSPEALADAVAQRPSNGVVERLASET